jgi:hypothetical protein
VRVLLAGRRNGGERAADEKRRNGRSGEYLLSQAALHSRHVSPLS